MSTKTTAESFLTQVWRVVRLGGVAALAASQGSTHVTTSGAKAGIVAGAVAFVEVVYRAAVPAKDQTILGQWIAAIKQVGASTAAKPLEAKLVAEIPSPVVKLADAVVQDTTVHS